ncbi:MAG: Methyltransferase-like protein 21D [Geoglossum umbratile]|nr:MAG: Methyltransferase-like protein 21D [Geoglossum umbratile]
MASPIEEALPENEEDAGLILPESLVASPAHIQPHIATVDFDGLLRTPLRLKEDLSEGCGGKLWPAGMVLARYLLRVYGGPSGEVLRGKKIVDESVPVFHFPVHTSPINTNHASTFRSRQLMLSRSNPSIELGAGGGLVGLALALSNSTLFTTPLYVTDQAPMLALMHENVVLNNLQDVVVPLVLDWGHPPPPSILPGHLDLVLAADCVYFEPAFPLLLQTLQDLAGPETQVLFCFKKRRRADLHFMKKARKLFIVEDVLDDPDRAAYSRENIFL